jgi:hypothetical protein
LTVHGERQILSRTQRDLISAPWRLIAEQPPTVRIGGSVSVLPFSAPLTDVARSVNGSCTRGSPSAADAHAGGARHSPARAAHPSRHPYLLDSGPAVRAYHCEQGGQRQAIGSMPYHPARRSSPSRRSSKVDAMVPLLATIPRLEMVSSTEHLIWIEDDHRRAQPLDTPNGGSQARLGVADPTHHGDHARSRRPT